MKVKKDKKSTKRKISGVYWTRDSIYKLIDLYQSNRNLWDVSLEQYKDRDERKSSIRDIADAMGFSEEEIKEKIHNLRCQFQSNHRKLKKTECGQGAGDSFKVKWEFYDALKFINDPTNIAEGATIYSLTSGLNEKNEELFDIESYASQHSPDYHSNSKCAESTSPSTSQSYTSLSSCRAITPRRFNKEKDVEKQAVLNRCASLVSQPHDSFDIFGRYIADELKNMHAKAPHLQCKAKVEIMRIILKMNDSYEIRCKNASSVNEITSDHEEIQTQGIYILPDEEKF